MVILYNEPMNKHTTMRTGGPAKRFCKVASAEDILEAIKECKEEKEPYVIVGNGSNLLVSDAGYDGTVIYIGEDYSEIKVEDTAIYAEAGAFLSKIANTAKDNSLEGFEFASGIPGSLGGAVYMNAGAYGGEMKDVVEYVDVIMDNEIKRIPGSEMDFSYRHSIACDKEMVIIGARINLAVGDKETITAKMRDLNGRRVEKQPLEYPSAGSTFKRPKDNFAGKLIMDSGLAGYMVGGARVSEKHCGFVINYDNATSNDVYKLMQDVIEIVNDKYNVKLEPEVCFLGEF